MIGMDTKCKSVCTHANGFGTIKVIHRELSNTGLCPFIEIVYKWAQTYIRQFSMKSIDGHKTVCRSWCQTHQYVYTQIYIDGREMLKVVCG